MARGPSAGLLLALLLGLPGLAAQQPALPPIEPPRPMPGEPEPLRVNSTAVLVPTLVEKKDGSVLYGLKADDFLLSDDGVPQKVRLEEDMDLAPVSLLVAVEQGRSSLLEFDKMAALGPLLELLVPPGRGAMALVGFDSQVHLIRSFTGDADALSADLARLEPGDGGAAILDTVDYAVTLLGQQPADHRRILLLVSEERDHGSRQKKVPELIERLGGSDVLVLGVAFSASRAEVLHDVEHSSRDGSILNPISLLAMAVQAMHRNVVRELTRQSGGEYTTFTRMKSFNNAVDRVARHARNRYLLSFQPSDKTPGLHALHVTLREDYGARILARANYWARP